MSPPPSFADRLSLVVITDPAAPGGALATAQAALAAGAPAIQLRWKAGRAREMLDLARQLRRSCDDADALFFVNDRVDVALASGADGVHLGGDDLPIPAVRGITSTSFLIGRSVDTPAEAVAARDQGADYVGVGPVYSTATKLDTGPVLGAAALASFRVGVPVVAIGGIAVGNAGEAIRGGADGVAVIGAVMFAPDPALATAAILQEIAATGSSE